MATFLVVYVLRKWLLSVLGVGDTAKDKSDSIRWLANLAFLDSWDRRRGTGLLSPVSPAATPMG